MTIKWLRSTTLLCGNSSVVEHNLAKVGVASSNLVSRSKFKAFRATEYCYSVCDPKGSRQRGCRLRVSFTAANEKINLPYAGLNCLEQFRTAEGWPSRQNTGCIL